jgi:hypothetical protein
MTQATRIRAEAAKLRASLESDGTATIDAIAQECGFLMGSIEGLCAQLACYTGAGTKPQAGCQIAEVNDSNGTWLVEYEYEPGVSGRTSGPPELCYPDEPAALTIIQVLVNGEWMDPNGLFDLSAIEGWEEKLCEEQIERDRDDAQAEADEWRQRRIDDRAEGL